MFKVLLLAAAAATGPLTPREIMRGIDETCSAEPIGQLTALGDIPLRAEYLLLMGSSFMTYGCHAQAETVYSMALSAAENGRQRARAQAGLDRALAHQR